MTSPHGYGYVTTYGDCYVEQIDSCAVVDKQRLELGSLYARWTRPWLITPM